MIVGKENLGLALTLGFSQNQHSPLLNLRPSLLTSSTDSCASTRFQKSSWNHVYAPEHNSECFRDETRLFLKGIDVNSLPCAVDCEEEEAGTISSVSGKRSEREGNNGHEVDIERGCSRGISDEEDVDASRKKLRLSKDQSAILEESFKEHSTLNPKHKLALGKRLGLRPRQLEVWFQNRRARTKLKQTEVDCEFLKRSCETLTEENRRLQKEVQELRALKLSPQFYMQMTPPTTLTMCPSCERVGFPFNASSTVDPLSQKSVPINPWALAVPISRGAYEGLVPRS